MFKLQTPDFGFENFLSFFFFFEVTPPPPPPPWIRQPFFVCFVLLVRKVGHIRWVPLLRVRKIDQNMLRPEKKCDGVPTRSSALSGLARHRSWHVTTPLEKIMLTPLGTPYLTMEVTPSPLPCPRCSAFTLTKKQIYNIQLSEVVIVERIVRKVRKVCQNLFSALYKEKQHTQTWFTYRGKRKENYNKIIQYCSKLFFSIFLYIRKDSKYYL